MSDGCDGGHTEPIHQSARSPVISSKMTCWECLCQWNDLGRRNRVTLIWVLGHVDLKGRKNQKNSTNWLGKEQSLDYIVTPENF